MKAYRTDAWIHHIHSFFSFSFEYFLVPCGKFRPPYPGKALLPQEWRYPFLSVCAVFSCVQTAVWLPVLRILNVHTDIDTCNCTWEAVACANTARKSVLTSDWEENALPHWRIEPTSILHLACCSVVLVTELSHPSDTIHALNCKILGYIIHKILMYHWII